MLPIMQLDRYERKGFAGQISDTSLLDVLTGVSTVDARFGTVVDVTATSGDDFKFSYPADAAAYAAAKRPAIVARTLYGSSNVAEKGYPVNLVESGRVWVIAADDNFAPAAQGPVALKVATGKALAAGVALGVAVGTSNAVRGLLFTGRQDVDINGLKIVEVQIRPQTK